MGLKKLTDNVNATNVLALFIIRVYLAIANVSHRVVWLNGLYIPFFVCTVRE